MTLAIGHKTTIPEKQIVIDVIREVRPPFDPVAVVDNFAALLKTYRISKVLGDSPRCLRPEKKRRSGPAVCVR
jgi:hypothetical protein